MNKKDFVIKNKYVTLHFNISELFEHGCDFMSFPS